MLSRYFRILVTVSALFAHGARADGEVKFALSAHQRLTWEGNVVDAKVERDRYGETDVRPIGVEFSVFPTRPMTVDTWNNPVTGGVEQRIRAAISHPIPVLRASHVSFYDKPPDLSTLAVDIVQRDPHEAEISEDKPIAIVGDGSGRVMMITFSQVTIPQDKPSEWRIAGTMKPIVLVDHIADPVADRGRAALAREPLSLSGTIVYGVRQDVMRPATFYAIDLAGDVGKAVPKRFAGPITEGRVAASGAIVDRVDMRTLKITSPEGKTLGEVTSKTDIAEFAAAPDGLRVAFSTERLVEIPNDLPKREIVTIVYKINGRKIAEIVGYDDPAFLPNGNLVLTGQAGDEGLYIADLATGKVSRIIIKDAIDDDEARGPWWPRTPAVSPDGKWVAYVSRRDAFVVGIDGTGWTPVWSTEFHEPQSTPVFSPDGKYVVLVLTQLNVMNGPGELVIFDLAQRVRQHIPAAKDANSEVQITWKK